MPLPATDAPALVKVAALLPGLVLCAAATLQQVGWLKARTPAWLMGSERRTAVLALAAIFAGLLVIYVGYGVKQT